MDEYISREEAIEAIRQTYCPNCDSCNGIMCKACGYKDCMDIVDDVKAADVYPVKQWISIKDRLPDEDDCYLVVIESEICVSIDIAEYSKNRWHKHDKVLYWQPLPELPKDGDSKC